MASWLRVAGVAITFLLVFITGFWLTRSGRPYGVAHAPAPHSRFRGSIEIERNNPEADRETRHPAVCRHPDSGGEMLFVNPTYTTRIDGYPARVWQRSHHGTDEYGGVVIVSERFLVVVDAKGRFDDDIVEDVIDELPMRRLNRLAG